MPNTISTPQGLAFSVSGYLRPKALYHYQNHHQIVTLLGAGKALMVVVKNLNLLSSDRVGR
jgi:hypothetical protein